VSYISPNAKPVDFATGDRVAYVEFDGSKQRGTVSSVNSKYVFVRFDEQVARLGWDGATSQSCDPRDLIREMPLDTNEAASVVSGADGRKASKT
jgi:hypothetical protein